MFAIKINFRDGSRPLVVTACPDAESARAIIFNANRDPNVNRCDIGAAEDFPTTTSEEAAVRDFETGGMV